jgi:hypothetical protein
LPVVGCSIAVHARFRDTTGGYLIVAFSDSDEVVCANREELGQPALLCDRFRLKFDGNTISAVVRRSRQLLVRITFFPEPARADDPPPTADREPLLLYKLIPNGDPRGRPLREIAILKRDRSQARVVERSTGRGVLELGTTIWNFHQIAPLQIVGASYLHFENGALGPAEVLWAD